MVGFMYVIKYLLEWAVKAIEGIKKLFGEFASQKEGE